jgi:hypothetical protein
LVLHGKKQQNFARLPMVRRAIWKAYGCLFILNGVWKLVWGISLWFGAYWLLKQTITYVRQRSTDVIKGQMYALGFFLSSFIASVAIHQLLSQSGRLGLRVRTFFYRYSHKMRIVNYLLFAFQR